MIALSITHVRHALKEVKFNKVATLLASLLGC